MLQQISKFDLVSDYSPTGDQPQAIDALVEGVEKKSVQTLLGVTGSGKTFSVANVIARTGKNTLVISHNKTLAAQLYAELKQFFLKIMSVILFHIMIIINLKVIFHKLILILKKTLRLMKKLKNYD